jgi:DNA-binding phage protein
MPLTRDFRETVKARADRDPAFRAGLYQEALQSTLEGDFGTAKILLRDFINATMGFSRLAEMTSLPEKSLMRMFGPSGNPRADNLLAVFAALKDECRVCLKVEAAPVRRRSARTEQRVTA